MHLDWKCKTTFKWRWTGGSLASEREEERSQVGALVPNNYCVNFKCNAQAVSSLINALLMSVKVSMIEIAIKF